MVYMHEVSTAGIGQEEGGRGTGSGRSRKNESYQTSVANTLDNTSFC